MNCAGGGAKNSLRRMSTLGSQTHVPTVALGMRAGKTFKEMAAEVMADTAMVNEAMAYVEPAPKRNPANNSTNDDDFQPDAPRRARSRGRGANRQYRRRTYDDEYRGGRRGGGGNRDRRGDRE